MISPPGEITIFEANDIHFSTTSDTGTRIFSHNNNLFPQFVDKANTAKPKALLLLGDVCQGPNDWAAFTPFWNDIDSSINKYATIGNHDLDDKSYTDLVGLLGYGSLPENAGSKFNQTYSIDGTVRLIMLDATFNASDEHDNHYQDVRIHSDAIDWIEGILLDSIEKCVLIALHCIPHQSYFDSTQRAQIKSMVDSVLLLKPSLKISWIGGHHHVLEVTQFTDMGSDQMGYILPAMVENSDGRYTVIKAGVNGVSTLTKVNLPYTG